MKIGQHFGELALINDIPRTATVTAISHCEFATLGRNDFDTVIKKNEAKQVQHKLNFLSKLPYFAHYS